MEMKMVLRCQAGRPVTRRAATPRRDDHPYFFSRFIIANISDNDEPTLTLHTCSTSRHGKRIRPYWTSRTAARAAFHPRWTAFQTPHRREGGPAPITSSLAASLTDLGAFISFIRIADTSSPSPCSL
jgi:hypothetical protein